uniref:Uncharacterized protein n=1 Tax=Meloidogyne javanica TaxID=6303 RepID=A0A915N700_MELJA
MMQVDELSKTRLINHSLEARISKMIDKDMIRDIAEMEKSEKMKRKAKGEEDEVYKIKKEKDKEDKDTNKMKYDLNYYKWINRVLESSTDKRIEKEMAEREKKERKKRKAKEEEDEVYEVKNDK